VVRASGNEVFALRDKTETGQCPVAVTGTSLSTAGVFGLAQSNANAACNLGGTGFPTSSPVQGQQSERPQAPSAFALRLKSVRSRRTRSAKTPRGTPR
jgi:hypothetical protein